MRIMLLRDSTSRTEGNSEPGMKKKGERGKGERGKRMPGIRSLESGGAVEEMDSVICV